MDELTEGRARQIIQGQATREGRDCYEEWTLYLGATENPFSFHGIETWLKRPRSVRIKTFSGWTVVQRG